MSSTESEFMAAADAGKMLLYTRSILYDLLIPQVAASMIYEDNDAATAIANAGKPTTRTRHMDVRYFSICDWVERDLLLLTRVDTSQNLADHFTKSLPRILFWRHNDYIMGHIPPPFSPLFKPGYESNAPKAVVAKLSSDTDPWDSCVNYEMLYQ